jgi:hypothetical protein
MVEDRNLAREIDRAQSTDLPTQNPPKAAGSTAMASKRAKNDRRKQEKRLKRLRRLKSKGERSPVDKPILLVHNPPGMERMSEVLEQFVEPYWVEVPDTAEDFRRILSIGVVAWNAALLPDDEQKTMIDRAVREGLSGSTEADRRDFRILLVGMIERKKTDFSHVKRAIISFHVRDEGNNQYYLNVASTLDH